MMQTELIRPLKSNEIECRVSMVNAKGVTLLLYKDARVDQRILDETFGAFGWKRTHQCIDGSLYCTVEIRDSKTGEWVAKQDVGTTGYTEKEKSQASDSFKRACFNWGIGRELYTAPFIWIPSAKVNIQSKGDKFYCNDRFYVHSIGYGNEREITALTIVNGNGEVVYELKGPQKTITPSQINAFYGELQRTGVSVETVQSRYKIGTVESVDEVTFNKVMTALSKTRSIA